MENINYLPVNQHGNENPPFSIRNTSSIHLQMVEFLLLIAMLIYRSAMCVCENSHHFKHLHFGDVGQACFEDIHRNNLTFGVTFPSHPEKRVKFHHSAGNLFLFQTCTPPKWPPCCFFGGPLALALSVHPTWGLWKEKKFRQFIQKQPKKKVLGFNPSSDVSILEKKQTPPKVSRLAWFFLWSDRF